MPKKVCGFSFDCSSMMLQPGLEPGECPNYATCGKATRLTPDEEIELIRVRQVQREEQERRRSRAQQEYELRQEVWRTTRREIALEMLMRRGCPQTVEQYIPNQTFEQLVEARCFADTARVAQLRAQLAEFEGTYIPPEETIAHRYWVRRPHGSYLYNKLMAPSAMFAPAQEEQPVRMIHLSRDDDPRNLEAHKGITRMHRLVAIREQLQLAQAAVIEAIILAQSPIEPSGAELVESTTNTSSSSSNLDNC